MRTQASELGIPLHSEPGHRGTFPQSGEGGLNEGTQSKQLWKDKKALVMGGEQRTSGGNSKCKLPEVLWPVPILRHRGWYLTQVT